MYTPLYDSLAVALRREWLEGVRLPVVLLLNMILLDTATSKKIAERLAALLL